MNGLKNILPQLMKPAVAGVPLFVLGALALAIPLGVVAFKWLKARADKRKQEKAKAPGAPPPPPKPRTDRLRVVWKQFLAQLPPTYRRSVLQFQPFLVVGAAASGKSQLIDTCSDWRQQKLQLAGGHVDDANLKIYLDSHALLLELPQTVLEDTSSHGRQALLRLWKPLFRERKPIVVVALDVMALRSLHAGKDADGLRDQADRLRGKLNLLAEVCRSPVEVRVALTHLDQVRGYAQFARFLSWHKASATLELHPRELGPELERALIERFTRFERLLPLALTHLSSEENLELVAFMSEGATYLPPVSQFLAALCAHNPLAPAPLLERVYFAAPAKLGGGANPFHPSRDEATRHAPSPLRGHRLAAIACAALGCLYLVAGYSYDRRLWKPAAQILAQHENIPEHLLADINRFSGRHDSGPMRFFPSFFSFQEKQVHQRLSEKIRTANLEKALEALETVPDDQQPHLRGLYLLAVLYATRDNPLGKLVLGELEGKSAKGWEAITGLSSARLKAYVHSTERAYGNKPHLERLRSAPAWDATNHAQPWLDFLHRLRDVFARGTLEPWELSKLQQKAGELLEARTVIQHYGRSQKILELLEKHTSLGLKQDVYANALPAVEFTGKLGPQLATVESLLKEVSQSSPREQESQVQLLSELNAQLRQLLEAGQPPKTPPPSEDAGLPKEEQLKLEVGGERFTFSAHQWRALLRDSTTSERLQLFMSPRGATASIFFSGQEVLPSLELNPLGESSSVFRNRASVEGRYTRTAFTQYVRPPVVTFIELAGKLQAAGKLSQEERTRLERYIKAEVQRYAQAYAAAMDRYYQGFRVEVGSVPELQFLLERMQEEGSAFTELLFVVSENTALPLDDGEAPAELTASQPTPPSTLLRPLDEALAHYKSLHRIMGNALAVKVPGKHPGELRLEGYRTHLALMSSALKGQVLDAPAQAEKKEDAEAPAEAPEEAPEEAERQKGLRERLSPAGLLTLDILLNRANSYDRILQKWLDDAKLDSRLRGPFLAPVDRLRALGSQEIQETVETQWRHHILPELNLVLSSFPFERQSTRDATPQELQALFHPRTGRFLTLTRQLIEPLSVRQGRTWKKRRTYGTLKLPGDLYPTLNNVQRLADSLWDDKENPRLLGLKVASVPFEPDPRGRGTTRARALLTLAALHSGTSLVVNFNQRPTFTPLELDWTRPRQARLLIETLDRPSGSKLSHPPLQSDPSPWSLLHLLNKGERQGNVWTWRVHLDLRQQDRGERPALPVKFEFESDPWALFELVSSPPSRATASSPLP